MAAALPWVTLSVAVVAFLWIDLKLFAREREPRFREAVAWSLGWLALSLLAALVIWPLRGGADAAEYVTVYLGVAHERRPRLLFWGIVAALALRGAAILGGVTLIERFHFVVYVLGATLLLLAWKIFKGSDAEPDPGRNFAVRGLRRVFPSATPLAICLGAIVDRKSAC